MSKDVKENLSLPSPQNIVLPPPPAGEVQEESLSESPTTQRLYAMFADAVASIRGVFSSMKSGASAEEQVRLNEALRLEAERQEFAAKMAASQAKVAQEIAIARRIETSEEVEMEEFFDTSGDGHAGLKSSGSSVTLGVGGQANRVSKRIFRFKGILTAARRQKPQTPTP